MTQGLNKEAQEKLKRFQIESYGKYNSFCFVTSEVMEISFILIGMFITKAYTLVKTQTISFHLCKKWMRKKLLQWKTQTVKHHHQQKYNISENKAEK